MKLKRQLFGPHHPNGPSIGNDVRAIKRGLNKFAVDFFPKPEEGFNKIYNDKTVKAVNKFRAIKKLDQGEPFNQETLDALWPYMDTTARLLYRAYAVFVPKPKLVKPNQGFDSLHKSLWEAYSLGRNMGMSDLGTYNPASRLPSGAPSDHALYPARAFDLGFSGYPNATADKFFKMMIGRPEVNYAIYGNKIWSVEKGLHAYTDGGHYNHVHVSGKR